jgi:hypothetical protein
LQYRISKAELVRGPRVQHLVLPQRVRDHEPDGVLDADEARDQLRAAPGGEDAEKDLRAGEVADARRDRSVVAVERDLDAAAEASAVDRSQRGEREVAKPEEELVPGAGAFSCLLGRDVREHVEVGPRREHEGLARQHEARPLL